MPTVGVGRDRLFEALGKTYTQEEFEELCFDFGIELDDVTTEQEIVRKEKHLEEKAEKGDEEVIYKIDVPANRYDLLCLEGLARALRIFLGLEDVPIFRLVTPQNPITMTVAPETALVRPFVACAVLRNLVFDEARYNSFIELQDKLHQNLCRRRSLVAIGTHDLDTLKPPFTYEALRPKDIKFVPLKQTKEFDAEELMTFYENDLKLKKFLPIIRDSPLYPALYDSTRTLLSLPPIINGAHSAIRLTTTNVFIEVTGTDEAKMNVVLNTVVTMFAECCNPKFEEMVRLLRRMQLGADVAPGDRLRVLVPPMRSDILHACDVMEDVAIAFGYNNVERTRPRAAAQGKQQPLNQFSDLLRAEVAQAGFTEVLTWALVSHAENFGHMKRVDDLTAGVRIGNPRSADFEVVRTSLLPGMLKTVGHNKDSPRPLTLFEVSDVVLLDASKDVGAGNRRRVCALYCNLTSGFEVIHGLVDRIMEVTGCRMVEEGDESGYYIRGAQTPEFFPGRQADVYFKGKRIGTFGIVHPEVLANFDIPDPCTILELDVEPLLAM